MCRNFPWNNIWTAIPRLESLGRRAQRDARAGPRRRRCQAGPQSGRRRHPPAVDEGDPRYGRKKGWKQILFGHIGREPEKSLAKVRDRLAEILGCEVAFIADWLDPATLSIKDEAAAAIRSAAPGSVLMLQNTRKYDIERVLWKAKPADCPKLAERLAKFANECAEKLAKVYVHEAFSAGSLDASSVVVPAAMDRVALGKYEAEQFDGPLKDCLGALLVVFSGLKADKLDDMEAMINRGTIRLVISAGSLAMALKKAAEELEGRPFNLGLSEDPAHERQAVLHPPRAHRAGQADALRGTWQGDPFVLPIDFVLQDGRVSETIGPGNQQLDIGPASSELFANTVSRVIERHRNDRPPAVVFHNGVFGMFEDPRFEEGTRKFVGQLKRMTDAGLKVYIGGGEGGTSLEKYGKADWVTYTFTAGGTVLNALGSEPVPYLVALKMAAEKK